MSEQPSVNPFFTITRSLHAWDGALLALLLFMSSVTGTLLLWKPEYLELTIPAARADFDPTPEALAPPIEKIEAQLDPNEIVRIQLPTRDLAVAKVTMFDTHYAYVDTQGNIVDEWFLNERWEEWLYDLHHRLLLGNAGLTIIGFVGMTMLLGALLSTLGLTSFLQGKLRGGSLATGGLPKRAAGRSASEVGWREALLFVLVNRRNAAIFDSGQASACGDKTMDVLFDLHDHEHRHTDADDRDAIRKRHGPCAERSVHERHVSKYELSGRHDGHTDQNRRCPEHAFDR
jgi:uncharacterized iron-regulated membrane protein